MTRVWLLIGLLSVIGCDGDSTDGTDGGVADCGTPSANNDPQCPKVFSEICTSLTQACSQPGLTCAYPGAGDGPDSHGCFATAMAWCRVPPGADGGATRWVCAQ